MKEKSIKAKSSKPQNPVSIGYKYNWPKLKAEFLAGDWLVVKDFLKDKNIPVSNISKTRGWTKDKGKQEQDMLEAAKDKITETDADSLVEVRIRQARIAKFMQLKGAEVLKSVNPKTADEARKLVVSGMREERKTLGFDGTTKQSLTQINILGPKTNLDKIVEGLDYEGILKLIAELKRERAGRSGGKLVGGSPDEVEEGEAI